MGEITTISAETELAKTGRGLPSMPRLGENSVNSPGGDRKKSKNCS
jgi:hypothetical protein